MKKETLITLPERLESYKKPKVHWTVEFRKYLKDMLNSVGTCPMYELVKSAEEGKPEVHLKTECFNPETELFYNILHETRRT